MPSVPIPTQRPASHPPLFTNRPRRHLPSHLRDWWWLAARSACRKKGISWREKSKAALLTLSWPSALSPHEWCSVTSLVSQWPVCHIYWITCHNCSIIFDLHPMSSLQDEVCSAGGVIFARTSGPVHAHQVRGQDGIQRDPWYSSFLSWTT